jgi:hypothetical protein
MRLAIDCVLAELGHTAIRLPPHHLDLNPIEKNLWYREDQNSYKNVIFMLRDFQQLAELNFAAVTMGERAAVCRHVTAVEEECMSREHEWDSVTERIIINADDDNNDERIFS